MGIARPAGLADQADLQAKSKIGVPKACGGVGLHRFMAAVPRTVNGSDPQELPRSIDDLARSPVDGGRVE